MSRSEPQPSAARALPDADALYAAACAAWREGRRGEAISRLDESLRRRPDFADALAMGGYMLSECGKSETALRFYRRALSLDPSLVVAHLNSGKLLFDLRRFAEARAAFETAAELAPDEADAWCSLAGALRELGRLEDGVEAAHRALALRPHFAEAAVNLGNALLKLDRMEEAVDAYRRARNARPDYAAAFCGEALALRNHGRFDEAFAAFETAEALGSREAVAGKGCLLLTLGDFERGFEGYEARWLQGRSLAEALGTRFPTWRGPGKPGERVLVLNDHGLGDTIQFVRYLPLMAEAGVVTTFVCPPRLRRLLSATIGGRFLDEPPKSETFDSQIAISSLPHAFKSRLETIPALVPYLAPMGVETLGPEFDSGPDAFVDTAAAMAALDLIITCDTSIAHLAGALARPVWVALKSDAEWRWMRDRSDSPWYPSMRLFRQTRRGVWSDVFEDMARQLARMLAERRSTRLIRAPCSIGELIDKITILRIKSQRITDEQKLGNLRRELEALEAPASEAGLVGATVDALAEKLAAVNARLWEVEDEIRICERERDFGSRFIALARSVYVNNDQRAALKRKINILFDSEVIEEKSYA